MVLFFFPFLVFLFPSGNQAKSIYLANKFDGIIQNTKVKNQVFKNLKKKHP